MKMFLVVMLASFISISCGSAIQSNLDDEQTDQKKDGTDLSTENKLIYLILQDAASTYAAQRARHNAFVVLEQPDVKIPDESPYISNIVKVARQHHASNKNTPFRLKQKDMLKLEKGKIYPIILYVTNGEQISVFKLGDIQYEPEFIKQQGSKFNSYLAGGLKEAIDNKIPYSGFKFPPPIQR